MTSSRPLRAPQCNSPSSPYAWHVVFFLRCFLLFVGSGCAALIYEIVWFQLLQLVIGSSAISLGVLLGTFMGGMCLGSLLLPRVHLGAAASAARLRGARARHRRHRPADPGRRCRWSAASTPRGRGDGIVGIVFRAVVAGICLLPPTMLMGATLPAISRWVKATPAGRRRGSASSTAATSPAA